MKPPPLLPVDVVSTWWDYVVDGSGVLSGLGAAGALLIAALAYSRQVDDALRLQATKVSVNIVEMETPPRLDFNAVNDSDQPIMVMSVHIANEPGRATLTADEVPFILFANDSENIGEVATGAILPKGWIIFIDAGGR